MSILNAAKNNTLLVIQKNDNFTTNRLRIDSDPLHHIQYHGFTQQLCSMIWFIAKLQ